MTHDELQNKTLACWLGKLAGGAVGAPYEGTPHPLNLGTRDMFLDLSPNDDLELQLVWLLLAEQHGLSLNSNHIGQCWLKHIGYGWDEYGVALRNLQAGLQPPASGYVENVFVDGMGAAIRSEIWACLFPEQVRWAAHFAAQDARVDHWGDGVCAEVFLAAMESAAFSLPLRESVARGLSCIPDDCRLAGFIRVILNLVQPGDDIREANLQLREQHSTENFTDCLLNVAFILAALFAEKNFDETVIGAINGGADTDCTGATAGAIWGILHGLDDIPACYHPLLEEPIAVSSHIRIQGWPDTLVEFAKRIGYLRTSWTGELNSLRTPDLVDPFPEIAIQTPDPRTWLLLDDEADPGKQAKSWLGEKVWKQRGKEIHAGLHMDVSEFFPQPGQVHLMTLIESERDLSDGQLMICGGGGLVVQLDGRPLLTYHGRRNPIPAFHRTEGGATLPIDLQAGQPRLLHIWLLGCPRPPPLTVAVGDGQNRFARGVRFRLPERSFHWQNPSLSQNDSREVTTSSAN